MTFEKRKADLLKKAASGKMRVDLAFDEVSGRNVGYCVSSINQEKTGEIESIFVDAAYRGMGHWRFTDEESATLDGKDRCRLKKSLKSLLATNKHWASMHVMVFYQEKRS